VVAFLLLGAVVNVAVAWGLAVLIDPFSASWDPGAGMRRGDAAGVFVRRPWAGQWTAEVFAAGGLARFSSIHNRAEPPWGPGVDGAAAQPDWGDPAAILPAWSGFREATAEFAAGGLVIENRTGDARGWPMLSLWHMPHHFTMAGVPGPSSEEHVRGGLALPLPPWRDPMPFSSRPDEPRVLPLWIIPHAFAINTAFYAAVLWGLFALPFVVRRRRRVRRGLCARCGYDLRGAEHEQCPECGAATVSATSRDRQGAVT
jgi:hypothetical protein